MARSVPMESRRAMRTQRKQAARGIAEASAAAIMILTLAACSTGGSGSGGKGGSGKGGSSGSAPGEGEPTRVGMFALRGANFDRHDPFELGRALSHPGSPPQPTSGAWNNTGLTFKKGELVFIEASGTIESQLLPQEPMQRIDAEGIFGWLSGVVFPLVNRTPGALYGRIGGSVFLIGKSTALLAPDEGPLEIVLNVCETCAVQGDFMLGVHTELSSAFALATDPPITDTPSSRP
jgi:hypothetical protein